MRQANLSMWSVVLTAGLVVTSCGIDEPMVIDRRLVDDTSEVTDDQRDDKKSTEDLTKAPNPETSSEPVTNSSNGPSPTPSPSAGPVVPTDPCVIAQDSFALNVQPGIEATCGNAGCHGTNSGGLRLDKGTGNIRTNRLTLRASVMNDFNANINNFINKFSRNTGHGGGNQAANMPSARVTEWWTKELDCTP